MKTQSKNVVNGVICSIARLEAETEKAVKLTFVVHLYGSDFVVRGQWLPKSMLNIMKVEDGKIFFTAKNNWILDKKTRDYCKYVSETFSNVKSEVKTYLSRINTEVVEQVFA